MTLLYPSFAEAYKAALNLILTHPTFVSNPRNQKIHELLNLSFGITDPIKNLFKNKARSIPLKYLKNELCLYFTSDDSVGNFTKASKFWENISDNSINSAYGYLIFSKLEDNKFTSVNNKQYSQIKWVLESLIQDKDSRQAIMFLGRPYYQYENNKDFVCTLNYHFFIRDNKLYMIVNRRSQDIYFGMTFDVPWELLLMQYICFKLQEYYPLLTLGNYYLNCNSLHAYERNFDILRNMQKFEFQSISTPKLDFDILENKNQILLEKIKSNRLQDISNSIDYNNDFLNWISNIND